MDAPQITIAVDGYSSCGKSTLARQLAHELGYIFIDSGAMYRGVTLFALRNHLIEHGEIHKETLIRKLPEIDLAFEMNTDTGEPELILNGQNVAQEIRTPEVSSIVSRISTIRQVREKLVEAQRKIGANGGIVMDGRDIGSVVFPHAELKIFVTADIETRTDRRFSELKEKGIQITREEVTDNLTERDLIDSTREVSPLIRAEDAIILDNTHLTREKQLAAVLELVHAKLYHNS